MFDKQEHNRKYYRRRRLALIQELGGSCVWHKDRTDPKKLHIHHDPPILTRSRPNGEALKPKNKILLCEECHSNTPNWKRKYSLNRSQVRPVKNCLKCGAPIRCRSHDLCFNCRTVIK